MAVVSVNDTTEVSVDTELVSKEVLTAYLQNLEMVYLQNISWLLGYPWVVAKNTTKQEDNPEEYEKEQKNLEDLLKEKAKMENNLGELALKIKFFKSLQSE